MRGVDHWPSGGQIVDTTTDDALGGSDMVDLLRRLERREVSPAELREAAVSRAHAADAAVNAVTAWVPEQRRAAPGESGPLAGIPTVVKDNEELAGLPTLQGSLAVRDDAARSDAPFVAQLRELGLDPIGKTTLPEFGLTATTESTRFGATRNPWDTSRSTGGSSGGSAALVAAGVVPLAHANDGGGSIRIPASCCGLVGLKPSRGRLIDLPEIERLPVNIITQGVVTRSVRDTARYFAEAEKLYANSALPRIGLVDRPAVKRLRIGVVTDFADRPVSGETMAALRATVQVCADLGHWVEEIEFPFSDRDGRDFLRYWALLAYSLKNFGGRVLGEPFESGRTEVLTDGLSRFLGSVAERVPLSLWRLRRWSRRPEAGIAPFDVLLTPVLGHEPPPIGYLGPDVDFRTHMTRLMRYAGFTAMNNVTGSPAISLPMGRSAAGLPLGMQFAAPVGGERTLLELALELEEAQPWRTTPAA